MERNEMDPFIQDLVRSILPALVIAPITAFLTVRFSLREYRSRWWWERKAEAYSNIIEQLAYLEVYLRAMWDDEIGAQVLMKEKKKELFTKFGELMRDLLQVSSKGSYIISDDAANSLSILIMELDIFSITEYFAGDIDRWAGAQKQAINDIRKFAKSNLGII